MNLCAHLSQDEQNSLLKFGIELTVSIYVPGPILRATTSDRELGINIIDRGSFLSAYGIRPHAATMIQLPRNTCKIE